MMRLWPFYRDFKGGRGEEEKRREKREEREEKRMTTQRIPYYRTVQTLGHALRTLYSELWPGIQYRQEISVRAPHADLCYSECVIYDAGNQILTIGFPSELVGLVRGFRNSHGVRMVTYVRDRLTDFIREEAVDQTTTFWLDPVGRQGREAPQVRIYTHGINDLIVSFDVMIVKGTKGARAKL